MGTITNGLNDAFGGIRVVTQNQKQAMMAFGQQVEMLQSRLLGLDGEVTRMRTTELKAIKEKCRKIDNDNLSTGRRVQLANENLHKIPDMQRELRMAREKIVQLEMESVERKEFVSRSFTQVREQLERLEGKTNQPGSSQTGPAISQQELIKEIQRLQAWVQALSRGFLSHME